MIKGICKLCKKEKELINKSHIIPDCMYNELYDENHKIYHFAPNHVLAGTEYIKRPSTGEYEGGILCLSCDGDRIGKYESYGCQFIYAKEIPIDQAPKFKGYKTDTGDKFLECTNINYGKFKLFLLSILWRMSISSRNFFLDVDLEKHEEIIRRRNR